MKWLQKKAKEHVDEVLSCQRLFNEECCGDSFEKGGIAMANEIMKIILQKQRDGKLMYVHELEKIIEDLGGFEK